MNKKDLVEIRNAVPSDVNFILATWLRGLRYGNEWFEMIDSKAFFENYNKVANAILSHPNTTVKVACLKEDHDVILGYAVLGKDCLHWAHIKSPWRKIGLATEMVPSTITKVTHLTRAGAAILKKRPGIKFDPFI